MKTLLFVCVHNAGRSQMAEAFANRLAKEQDLEVRAISAGTMGGSELNATAVLAMLEVGIDMTSQHPKVLTQAMVDEADRVITMGCGVDASSCPTRFLATEDWNLDDPAGEPLSRVREIRDQIRDKVRAMLGKASEPQGS